MQILTVFSETFLFIFGCSFLPVLFSSSIFLALVFIVCPSGFALVLAIWPFGKHVSCSHIRRRLGGYLLLVVDAVAVAAPKDTNVSDAEERVVCWFPFPHPPSTTDPGKIVAFSKATTRFDFALTLERTASLGGVQFPR